jgi:hypothetical protein
VQKILRKTLHVDSAGNILSAKTEELTDDEAGTVNETCVTAVSRCQACNRPVEKIEQMRGICISCGLSCCSLCGGACAVCGAGPFCGRCKTGWAGTGLSVCSDCQAALKERQAQHDELVQRKLTFEQMVAVCNTQLKLAQVLQQNRGDVSRTLGRIGQLRVARKIARLERQLKRENGYGKRLLP